MNDEDFEALLRDVMSDDGKTKGVTLEVDYDFYNALLKQVVSSPGYFRRSWREYRRRYPGKPKVEWLRSKGWNA